MALSLDDFFGYNQSQDDENFTILDKKHLIELKPALYEKKPKPGEVFIHQELSGRIIADYDRLLLHHQAGTGKTRVIIHSREYFRSFMEEQDMPLEMRRFNINKAYILTPSRTLINEFRKEIINHMGSFYEEHIIAKRSTAKDEGALIKAINKYYEILTHGEFVKIIENKNPSDLHDFMSNCVIYVDEAHKTSTIEDRGEGGKNIMTSNTSTYVQLHKAFHTGVYNKIVLLTATPMINLPKDILLLMNLILPMDRQMKESLFNWDDPDTYPEQFGSYFRGYVSYILRGKTGAIKTNVGTNLYNPSIKRGGGTGGENISVAPSRDGKELGSTIIEYALAGKYQNDVYLNSGLTGSLKSFGTAQMQMSNFVFPPINDRKWGVSETERFKEAPKYYLAYEHEQSYLNPDQKARKFNTPEIKIEHRDVMIKALTTDLHLYSSKLAKVREIIQSKYVNRDLEDPDYLVPDNKGICFIYSHLVKYGVEMAALMLKNNGYTEFNEKHSVFKTKPFANKDRVMDIQKAPRYFLMTGSTSPSIVSSALELLNSYENRFGEYIQVFIGSEVASHGLSINHAVAMLFLTPLWNHTNEEQSQDRVFRSVSHDVRLKYKADNNMPSPESIQVEVYKLATIFQTEQKMYESVDFYLYQLSTIKDDSIKPMIDTIRKYSIDCVNNSERNQSNDCINSQVQEVDYSEKLKWYVSKEQQLLIKILEEQLFIRDYISVKELQELSKLDVKVLHVALLEIINMKVKFMNRLGIRMMLNHSNGMFFLGSNLYLKGKLSDLDYTKWFLGVKNYEGYNLLQDYIDHLAEEKSTSIFEDIKLVKDVNELKKILPSDYKTRIGIFEKSFESVMKGNPSLGEKLMYDKYKNQVYRASEPIQEINKLIAIQDRPAKGRKAGIGKGGKTKIEDRSLHTQVRAKRRLTEKDQDVIYLHMMIPIEVAPKVALADFNKAEGYIRVFKSKEGRWRQCNQTEYEVYQVMIANYRAKLFRDLDVSLSNIGVYGLKINDLIVIKTFNGEIWNNGKQCNNYKSSEKEIIINRIYNYLRLNGISQGYPNNSSNCKDLIDYLQYAGLLFTDKFNDEMVELSSPESYDFTKEEEKEEFKEQSSAVEEDSSSLVGYKEEDYAGFGNFM